MLRQLEGLFPGRNWKRKRRLLDQARAVPSVYQVEATAAGDDPCNRDVVLGFVHHVEPFAPDDYVDDDDGSRADPQTFTAPARS